MAIGPTYSTAGLAVSVGLFAIILGVFDLGLRKETSVTNAAGSRAG